MTFLKVVGDEVSEARTCAKRAFRWGNLRIASIFGRAYSVSGAFGTCMQHRPCRKTPHFPHFRKIPDV